jgi:hypothetical protein
MSVPGTSTRLFSHETTARFFGRQLAWSEDLGAFDAVDMPPDTAMRLCRARSLGWEARLSLPDEFFMVAEGATHEEAAAQLEKLFRSYLTGVRSLGAALTGEPAP